ncbi:hypothetical protein PHAVU_002G069200 [Phaseolus vulgaris]|uniref:Uncharacterized protein n=1 Tax=Phaseolus vulgaris TaxID=3885 RepID=V7CJF2_PHAVU|nr:hypothetical protein PHAVU_002G069200g [Phaseolus vulgaris]ESW29420.1 hypothetical protein PHAVU_002G069200g [Phaseolus vulgaris]
MWLTSLHMCIHGLSTLKTYKLTCLHSPNLFNSQENLVLSKLEGHFESFSSKQGVRASLLFSQPNLLYSLPMFILSRIFSTAIFLFVTVIVIRFFTTLFSNTHRKQRNNKNQ